MVSLPPNADDPMKMLQNQLQSTRIIKNVTTQGTSSKEQERTQTDQNKQQDRVRQGSVEKGVTADVQDKGMVQDTMKSSATVQKTISQTTQGSEKPSLKAPEQHGIIRSGRVNFTFPQSQRTNSEQILKTSTADSTIKETSSKMLNEAIGKGDIPKGMSPEKFTKQVLTAVTNPQANVSPEAKGLADQIRGQAAQNTAANLNISPEEADSLVNSTNEMNQDVRELRSGEEFNKSFQTLLDKNVSPKYHNALNFAKDNPEYAKFLPSNLQNSFDKLMNAATSQTMKNFNMEGSKIPYNTERGNAGVAVDVKNDYNEQLTQMRLSGKVSEQDSNRLQNLFSRPEQAGMPKELVEKSQSMLKEAYENTFTEHSGIKDPSVEAKVFKEANDFRESFEEKLDGLKPPISEELKKQATDFLTNKDPRISKEAKEAFNQAMSQALAERGIPQPPSPFTLRRAAAFQKGMEKSLSESSLPKEVQKQVLADKSIDPKKFENLPNAQDIAKQLGEVSEKSFGEMRNAIGSPFGDVRNFGDHRHFVNTLKRAMQSGGIGKADQQKILNALKEGKVPPELKGVVEQLLKQVTSKVVYDRGLPDNWTPDTKMLHELDNTKFPYEVGVYNNYDNYMTEQMDVLKKTVLELFGGNTAMPGLQTASVGAPVEMTSAPQASAQQQDSPYAAYLNISIGSFIEMIGKSLNDQREVTTEIILSNTQIQTQIQNWQREMIQNERDLNYQAYKDQQAEQQKNSKSGPFQWVGKVFNDIKLGLELTFAPMIPGLGFAIEAALIEQISTKGWNQAAQENMGAALTNSINDIMKKAGVSEKNMDIIDLVLTVSFCFMPLGPLIAFQACQVTIPQAIEDSPWFSDSVKNKMIMGFDIGIEVIKLAAQIAMIVVLFMVPGAEEFGVEEASNAIRGAMDTVDAVRTGITAAEGALDVATTAEEVLTTTQQIGRAMEQLSQVAIKMEQIATEASKELETALKTIEECTKTLDSLTEAGKEAEQVTEKLNQAYTKIQDLTRIIEDASKAAQEASKLAETATNTLEQAYNKIQMFENAAKEIEQVSEILDESRNTLSAIQKSAQTTEQIASDAAQATGDTTKPPQEIKPVESEAPSVDVETKPSPNAAPEALEEKSAQELEDLRKQSTDLQKTMMESLDKAQASMEEIEESAKSSWQKKIDLAKKIANYTIATSNLVKGGIEMGVGIDKKIIADAVAELQMEIAALQAELQKVQSAMSMAEAEYQSLGKDTQNAIKALQDQWKMEQTIWSELSQTISGITGALYNKS